jgi:GNAT superfamily N-acetyltransferase
MSRLAVEVRTALPEDAPALVALWDASTADQASRVPSPSTAEAMRSIARGARDPYRRLQVAVVNDEVVGVAHLDRSPLSPLHEEEAVHVTHLFVKPGLRRRGVGRALLTHAAVWADEAGATQLLAAVAANSRDANRFLACLGLSQTAMVRSVPVAVLRQRLAINDAECADTPALQARRRTLLRRQITARESRQSLRRLSAHL